MKLNASFKKIFVEIVCYLYILLFVYAAVTKLLDFENFTVQLGQSPVLSSYASVLSWMVPIIELVIVILLSFSMLRTIGIWCALTLMALFTGYIIVILLFSPFVPCSCGGILEEMTWKQHVYFNIFFIVIAIIALFIQREQQTTRKGNLVLLLTCPLICALAGITNWFLFIYTQDKIQNDNPFIRRFPPHAIEFIAQKKLPLNSYYFAGSDTQYVYLGNYTAPLHLLRADYQLKKIDTLTIKPASEGLKNIPLMLLVNTPDFYLYNGKQPIIYNGKIMNWRINNSFTDLPYFTDLQVVQSRLFVFKGNRSGSGDNVVGLLHLEKEPRSILLDSLIQPFKNGDGIFDLDGTLLSDNTTKSIIYVHRYCNKITTANQSGNMIYQSKTIDTISQPRTMVKKLNQSKEMRMTTPPPYVNRKAVVSQGVLFVDSALKGLFDDKKSWEMSSTIDTYDLKKQSNYLFSLYLPAYNGKKARDLWVSNGFLFALFDNHVVSYALDTNLSNFLYAED